MSQDTQRMQQAEEPFQLNNQSLNSPNENHSIQKTHAQSPTDSPMELISLLNFNPQSKSRQFLTSPRSIEAVRNLEFEESELLMKRKEDFINDALPEEFANEKHYYAELKLEHYELRRLEKVKMCLQERKRLINKWNGTLHSHSISLIHNPLSERSNPSDSKSFIEQERKKILQMKNKQKNEIEFIISNELRIQEIKKKSEEKMKKVRDMEQKRQEEVKAKQELSLTEKLMRDQRKHAHDIKMEEITKEMFEKHEQDELKRKEKQQKLKKEREEEAKRRDAERKIKLEFLDQKLKQLQQRRAEESSTRLKEMEEKSAKIKQMMLEQQSKKLHESEVARRQFEEKLQSVKSNYEQILEDQRRRFDERQNEIAEKRERYEEMKRQELNLRRVRSEEKVKEIKQTLDVRFKEEQKKKESYTEKLELAEKNKKKLEEEMERRRLQKIRESMDKEKKMKELLKERERTEEERKSQLSSTISTEIRKADQRKEDNLKEIQRKYLVEIIHSQDAEENQRRLEKIEEKKRKKLLERMVIEKERLEKVKEDRAQQLAEKRRLQNVLDNEKERILKEFESNKTKLLQGQLSSRNEGSATNTNSLEMKLSLNTTNNSQYPIRQAQKVVVNKPIAIATGQNVVRSPVIKSVRTGSVSNTRSIDLSPYLSMTPRTKYNSSKLIKKVLTVQTPRR